MPAELRALAKPIDLAEVVPDTLPANAAPVTSSTNSSPSEATTISSSRALIQSRREVEILASLQRLTATLTRHSEDQVAALQRLTDAIERRPAEIAEVSKMQKALEAIETEMANLTRRVQRSDGAAAADGHHAMAAMTHAFTQAMARLEDAVTKLDRLGTDPASSPHPFPIEREALTPFDLMSADSFELKTSGDTSQNVCRSEDQPRRPLSESYPPAFFPAYARRRV